MVHGADPNNIDWYLPLHRIVKDINTEKWIASMNYESQELLSLLLDYGAEPHLKESEDLYVEKDKIKNAFEHATNDKTRRMLEIEYRMSVLKKAVFKELNVKLPALVVHKIASYMYASNT